MFSRHKVAEYESIRKSFGAPVFAADKQGVSRNFLEAKLRKNITNRGIWKVLVEWYIFSADGVDEKLDETSLLKRSKLVRIIFPRRSQIETFIDTKVSQFTVIKYRLTPSTLIFV